MIGIGCDHAALELKQVIIRHLEERGLEYKDYGTYTADRADYPVYGYKVACAVASGECDRGIVVCGTGVGISLAANKVHGIRCCVCSDAYTAKLSKEHNNANMLAMGARVVGPGLATLIVDAWLDAKAEGGRHAERVDMIMEIEATGSLAAAKGK